MKILVADDDAAFRILLVRMIRNWGHEAVPACDGAEALRHLHEPDGPRLAILDWNMPEIDGLELCRRIRGGNFETYVYIVLLTARPEVSDLLAGMEAGADDYIRKTSSLEELRLRVQAACRILAGTGQQPAELHLRHLRRLYGELLRAQDEEKAKIARELHEDIAQTLSGTALRLTILSGAAEDPGRRSEIEQVASDARNCIRNIQDLSYRLHPPLLDEIGLGTALRSFAERRSHHPGVEVDVDVPEDLDRLGWNLEMAIFRMAQESVAVLGGQFRCSRARIRVECGKGEARLSIRGEGASGPPAPYDAESTALLEIGERAQHHEGRVEIVSLPDGASIELTLPLKPAQT